MIAVLVRDLTLAVRSGGGFVFSLGFFVIVVLLVPLGVGPDAQLLASLAPGMLWVMALLAVLLSLDRIFALDYEDGSLTLLTLSPLPIEGLVLMKGFAHWLTTGLPLSLISPFLGLFLHLPAHSSFVLCGSLLIGTVSLSMLGSFGAALILGIKRGGLLLSLLILPFYIPTLIFGAEAVRRSVELQSPVVPLLVLSCISLGCCAVLPYITGAILRITLR